MLRTLRTYMMVALIAPTVVRARLEQMRGRAGDRGASAGEWAIIAAAVCVLAALVYAAVSAAVNNHVKNIK